MSFGFSTWIVGDFSEHCVSGLLDLQVILKWVQN